MQSLPLYTGIAEYIQQAAQLYAACQAGDRKTLQSIRNYHPHFSQLSDEAFRQSSITIEDVRLAIARYNYFDNWHQLTDWIVEVNKENSTVAEFETAAEAVMSGDTTTLQKMLKKNPALIHARSLRPHHSTLLHYIGANGVENQRTPSNAIDALTLLLDAGAEVDATADMYGGGITTLGLVATSIWPAKAGVLIPLMEALLQAGAVIKGGVQGCLHNGRPEAADFLARRGATLDLEGAAGVGRLDLVKEYFDKDGSLKAADMQPQLELGFVWACEFGHTDVVGHLLTCGLDPNLEVDGMYGLHWALIGGHTDIVRLLIAKGASLEVRNKYGGTALGAGIWALINSDPVYRWPKDQVVDYFLLLEILLQAGAIAEPDLLQWLALEEEIPTDKKEKLTALLIRNKADN